ncbi:HU family DNA-binding protein [Chryseobacterium sp.]|uniref:HU family DNA-binding protein n=1 Tax=Chryseobacterium sp. TaxID=1871047 RepID=UPI001B6D047E|nr:integration host factor subunit beta [Candidatus Chryseobacterium enterohippi]
MTKAELVNTISNKLGTEKNETQKVVEAFMQEIRTSMYNGDNVYLRGFGSFIVKTRAAKTGRNISKNTAIEIPAHNIPAFKPSKSFVEKVKIKVAVK